LVFLSLCVIVYVSFLSREPTLDTRTGKWMVGIKLYCLVTEAHACEQLA